MAADYPDRVARLAVAEAAMPGVSPSPPLFGSTAANDRLWHFAFNRLAEVNDQLAADREHIYFGFQFAKAAKTLPVLAIGGSEGIGEGAANTMKLAADDVQSVVIAGSGHYCLEEAPEEMLAALTAFLAPTGTR